MALLCSGLPIIFMLDPACVLHEIANRIESLDLVFNDETRAALARLNGACARSFRAECEREDRKNYVVDEEGDP